MNELVDLSSPYEMISYYKLFFSNKITSKDRVLYVGYEDEDILLPIISKCGSRIVAIDRENRNGVEYQNVNYQKIDFLEADFCQECFDFIIFSFVLHENDDYLHEVFIKKARKMSSEIIIIEPLTRRDVKGKQFEEDVEKHFVMKGMKKHYYSENYWKNVSGFNETVDDSVLLRRNCYMNYENLSTNEGKRKVTLQDIIILVCKTERK